MENPVIQTPNLLLSLPEAADIPHILQHAAGPDVAAYTLNLPYPYTERDAVFWINMANQGLKNKTNYVFAIRPRPGAALAGGISLTVDTRFSRAELGYWLGQPFWNKGITTEAAKAVIHFAFHTLHLNKITSSYLESNPASGRVMEKCGMEREGVLKQHVCKGKEFHNLHVYGLVKSDYLTAR